MHAPGVAKASDSAQLIASSQLSQSEARVRAVQSATCRFEREWIKTQKPARGPELNGSATKKTTETGDNN